ncbi:methyltransferase domain-containing protein [Colletotrichum orchidophilum]|uniref:Methyltransferase domain-containing protein n=1 Tax=Colletotrichum orchidophilum TaxID=1209926 RepID=A0A1G4BRF5_9PEZI|nr:methyltransferase domain-containing protein [Colletotrichum orchidophilum]OHF04044.1 methyltransferase domain-containing protein [Colletotrichum orchidophilum]
MSDMEIDWHSPGQSSDLTSDDGYATDSGVSSMDEQISTYTKSITSSIVNYPQEYGRRYHAYRAGVYAFPNDDPELDRMDMAHVLMFKSIGYKLYLAPLVRERVIGIDLSAVQPPWVPHNVKFEIDDIESPWVGDRMYDYIFVRYMLVSIQDWPKLVQNIYEHLNPGGWVEFQDMDGLYYSDDGTYAEHYVTRLWNQEFVQACESIGRTARPGPQLEGWVTNAGFQNVVHKRFKAPIGPWPKDAHFKDVGMHNLCQLLNGLEGFSLRLFCGVLGRSEDEVLSMLSNVREELKRGLFHAMFDHHVVYGQKPLEGQQQQYFAS